MKADVNSVLNGANNDNFVTPYTLKIWGSKNKGVAVGPNEPTNGQDVWFKQSRNLFNKNNAMKGFELDSNSGDAIPNASFFISEYIEVHPGQVFYVSGKSGGGSNCLYNSNKDYIGYTYRIEGVVVILQDPSIKYMRINGPLANLDTTMLNLGNSQKPYSPYTGNEILTYNGNEYSKFNIVESGSNENGSYIKFDGGTMICYGTRHLGGILINIPFGNLYINNPADCDLGVYPVSFIEMPATLNLSLNSDGSTVFLGARYGTSASKIGKLELLRPQQYTADTDVSFIAIGRWK